jgi:hypothetical protein
MAKFTIVGSYKTPFIEELHKILILLGCDNKRLLQSVELSTKYYVNENDVNNAKEYAKELLHITQTRLENANREPKKER